MRLRLRKLVGFGEKSLGVSMTINWFLNDFKISFNENLSFEFLLFDVILKKVPFNMQGADILAEFSTHTDALLRVLCL